jgi:hypothetical protein
MKMIRQLLLTAAGIAAVTTTAPAFAQKDRSAGDRLIIDNVNQPEATAGVRPNRGMSMKTVESRWGAPAAKLGAIGDPPISRWEYAEFVVYFEYGNVIHAVKTATKSAS